MKQFLNNNQVTQTSLPEWFAARQEHALKQTEQVPAPSRRMETWRFGAPDKESLEEFQPAPPINPADIPELIREHASMPDAIRIIYANGLPALIPDTLPEGLVIMTMAEFIAKYPETAREHLQNLPETMGSERLAALNTLHQHHGLVIMADGDQECPLEILHFISGNGIAVFPYTLIISQPNARLRILERHISADNGSQFCIAVQEHRLAATSCIKYGLVQELNHLSRALELSHITADDSSLMEHFCSHPGASWARQETMCVLAGAGADVRLLSANHLTERRELDQRTHQRHAFRGASSNLLYTNVLDDDAKSIFSGMILVEPGAHDTSAYQSNRNLIIGPRAEANSIPGLEILADGVQCSHGSATSSISPEEIFYLLSRGIPEKTARRMIAQGFLSHAVDQFSDEAIRSTLKDIILDSRLTH